MDKSLKPGDIVIILDDKGYWSGGYRYVGDDQSGRLLVHELHDETALYGARPDMVKRASVARPDEDVPSAAGREAGNGITAAQRKTLFATAKRLGMDLDDLRAATPRGSVSALTRAEASELIDRLKGHRGRGGRLEAQGTATSKQLGAIVHLRDQIGFTDAEFTEWLAKRFKVASIAEVRDKALASRIIGGLIRMHENREGERANCRTYRSMCSGTGS